MKKNLIPITFLSLIFVFFLILGMFFVPQIRDLAREIFLSVFIVFSLLGALLIFLVLKQEEKSKLRKFLILTGISALGTFIAIFLHNAFYALGVLTENIIALHYFMEAIHVFFFLVAIFVCPVGFIMGVLGVFLHFFKKRKI